MTHVEPDRRPGLKARLQCELPNFAKFELRKSRHYGQILSLTADIDIAYRCGRYRSVALSRRAVMKSEMFGWLLLGGKRVGAISIDSYRLDRCHDNDEFIEIMDRQGGHEYELAQTLSDAWTDVRCDVAYYGPLLDLRAVWIASEHRRADLLERIIQLVTKTIWPNYSIIVLKAWPLEGLGITKARRRQAAMVRYYSLLVRAEPFPGSAGRDGWLWATHPGLRGEIIAPRKLAPGPSLR